jgi:hypothetical protein
MINWQIIWTGSLVEATGRRSGTVASAGTTLSVASLQSKEVNTQ